jgi:4a-hydroxytetrahydrobiopterin dehydratase
MSHARPTTSESRLAELPGGSAPVTIVELQAPPFMTITCNRVAELAEAADHHPDLDIRWRRVMAALTTHDQGGLTAKDFDLAARMDAASGVRG